MNEVDDRLAGDAVWELFAQPVPLSVREGWVAQVYPRWVVLASLIGVGALIFPPLAVLTISLAAALDDFRIGRRLRRSISDKAGGTICARFRYAWGAWKLGIAGLVSMFVLIGLFPPDKNHPEPPSAFLTGALCCVGGFVLSAAWTCWGMVTAWRSGMRVWIGEGANRARTLLLSMLIVGFTFGVLIPWCLSVVVFAPPGARSRGEEPPMVLIIAVVWSIVVAGPVGILLLRDWFARRVVADRPGKFGPKVPTVGK